MRLRLAERAGCIGAAVLVVQLAASSATAATSTDLVIRVAATSFQVGRVGTYSITVTNNGPAPTDDVVQVSSTLPDGLTFATGRGNGWTCSGGGQTFSCQRTTSIDVARSALVTVEVDVCSAAEPSVTSSFRADYAGETKPTNNLVSRATVVKSGVCVPKPTATVNPNAPTATRTPTRTRSATQTPVPAVADLSIIKLQVGRFVAGTNGAYTITVLNNGGTATNTAITVTDALPRGLGYVSGSGTDWVCSANASSVVTCTRGTPLGSGQNTQISLVVSVDRISYPSVTNTATLDYAGDPDPTNNTGRRPTSVRLIARASGPSPTPSASVTATATATRTPVVPVKADLSLGKRDAARFVVGTNGTYVLTVRNNGAETTNLPFSITDSLPDGLTFVSSSGGSICRSFPPVVTCSDIRPLEGSETRTINLIVAVGEDAYPSVTNTATLSYPGDNRTSNNTAVRPTTVRR